MRSLFVLDGDDTLWMTEWQYSEAYATFFRYLYEILKNEMPAFHLVWERYMRKEHELYREWGVRKGRLSEAMSDTYRDICLWVKFRFNKDVYSEAHENHIREIGLMPFEYERLQWAPGAETVLQKLKEDGHKLCFLSSFDKEVFPKKADHLRISRFFDKKDIRLTEFKKTKEDFVAVSRWHKECEETFAAWFAVGNGESDVRPALDISEKWRGISMPFSSTSQYFRGKKNTDYWAPDTWVHPRVVTIRSIAELLSVV